MKEGIVLGHLIPTDGIKVDPAKIGVILKISVPLTQKELLVFWDIQGTIEGL